MRELLLCIAPQRPDDRGLLGRLLPRKAADRIQNLLTDEEMRVYKRGRNTRVHSVPHHAQISEYHAATGLEALFGYLFLQGRKDRLNELFLEIHREEL